MVPLRLYCIYDSKAEQFSPPQVYHNDMLALRAFEGLVNDDKTLINSYPEDFSLHYVGNLGDSVIPVSVLGPVLSLKITN